MDSACRNQQGNCDKVENSARQFFAIFLALWLNLCNNSDQTLFSNALTFAKSLGRCWKPRPSASVFNISLGTWQTLMHGKACLIPILIHGFSPVNARLLTMHGTAFYAIIVFQSYQEDGRLIMKGCVQWSSFYGWEDFASSRDRTRSARSVGQRLTHWDTRAHVWDVWISTLNTEVTSNVRSHRYIMMTFLEELSF